MSSQTGYQLILCVICGLLTSLSQGQPAMSCTTCPVGYTCSMVRHGTGRPQPGCITMQEAIMLNQAMQGGPSGPGTGISVPSTLGAPQNTMPGMEWGSNAPGGQGSGFGQRFNQGIIGTPATMFNPQAPNSLAFGGASQPGMQLRGTGQTGMPFGAPPGQFSGQTGFGGSPGGFPQGGPMVGGFGAPPGFIDPTTGQGFDQGPFRRVNDQSTGTNHLHDRSGSGTSGVDVGSGFSGQDQQIQGEVSTIQEDTYGYYYMFYPVSGQSGIRVNITKGGFCSRGSLPTSPRCAYNCYSDMQCPGDEKCCPSGCSLGCALATNPTEQPTPAPVGPATGLVPQEGGMQGDGLRAPSNCAQLTCDTNDQCAAMAQPGVTLYCFYSADCARRICQTV
ncbi:uncharacterized protein LOC128218765 isoform X3 [Mya arenaria]|uniref:uncharacterized protein LOC128218765 isoform X3 n=1 Tax=Mya arenaria TaxID=6604 RepID=UPI0022E66275|nr:uncharacterized protein LOC128218765 isoform X3 [Mya arenaria]